MHLPSLLSLFVVLLTTTTSASDEKVTTEYTLTKECTRKTQRGDTISVHYRGTLASDGTQFDASYDRGTPLDFTVGRGMVIKGWVVRISVCFFFGLRIFVEECFRFFFLFLIGLPSCFPQEKMGGGAAFLIH